MKLGINFTHDSSVVLTNNLGEILFAQQEERINRNKNTTLFPKNSIRTAVEISKQNKEKIESVHFGSKTPFGGIERVLLAFEDEKFASFDGQYGYVFPPGVRNKFSNQNEKNNESIFKEKIADLFPELEEIKQNVRYFYENHQDSHASSAFFASGYSEALAISLDGHGDGESGSVSVYNIEKKIRNLARFKDLNSFGHLYAAVTERYNFKPLKHEGKITGLAAFGNNSPAFELLLNYLEVKNGVPYFRISDSKLKILVGKIIKRSGISRNCIVTLRDLIDVAESKTNNYPDLAFAVQEVLNNLVVEIINYWISESGVSKITAAGGVFANVKLNQIIWEKSYATDFFVFPAMGDSGIAAGSIWNTLYRMGEEVKPKFQNVFLGNSVVESADNLDLTGIEIEEPKDNLLYERIAQLLTQGNLVGVIKGRMEFGPRALCNRTLLIDPRHSKVNAEVNKRLNRTEFMPFAPVCMERDFDRIFSSASSQRNYHFMTQTCFVRPDWVSRISAAVHHDGTARPQVIPTGSDQVMEKILVEFEKLTGCSVLINTSLNVHEEPIVNKFSEILPSLRSKSIDYVLFEDKIYSSK